MAKISKFEKLVKKADDAGKLRRYAVNPDVVALRAERTTNAITALMWSGVIFGLAYTIPNVASFMGGGFTGWFVSPAINAPLFGLLLAHSMMARYDEKPSWRVQVGKFMLLAFEYGMNTWVSWSSAIFDGGPASEVFKHSVPMVIVVFCVEGVTDLRGGLARCVAKAYKFAAETKREISDVIPVSAPPAIEESAPVVEEPAVNIETPEPVVIEEPAPVEETKPEPEIVPETVTETKFRPAGGKRAQQLAEDIEKMREVFPGLDFLLIEEKERAGKVASLFECGNSRAYRIRDEYTKIVEDEARQGVR